MINLDEIGSRVLRGVTSPADVQTLLGEAQNLSLSLDPQVVDKVGKGMATPSDIQYLYHAVELDYSVLYNRPTAQEARAADLESSQLAVAQAQAARLEDSQVQAQAQAQAQAQWMSTAQATSQAQKSAIEAQVTVDRFKADLKAGQQFLKDRKDKALQIQEVLDAATS